MGIAWSRKNGHVVVKPVARQTHYVTIFPVHGRQA